MESMRDIDGAMEREIAKGSCPLRFVKIDFGDTPYQEIASKEKLLEVLSYLLRTGSYGRFAGKGTGNKSTWTSDGESLCLSVPILLLDAAEFLRRFADTERN